MDLLADSDVIGERDSLPRILPECEMERLQKQVPASDYKKQKLRKEVCRNWDVFYCRNEDKFFKDRWWTEKEFFKICEHLNLQDKLNYVDVGCGVGNLIFPLKKQHPNWHCYGFDFSRNAVQILRDRATTSNLIVTAEVADLSIPDLTLPFPLANLVTVVFVLGSLPPEQHIAAVRNVRKLLVDGGTVVVRDYGINDHAMIRFGRGCKLDKHFYARQDGTLAYYFRKEELDNLFGSVGFRVQCSEYVMRKTVNFKKDISADRVFVQGVYIKV